MRKLRGLLASFGDSGAAAAASFAAGIISLRVLTTDQLALYALLYSAGIAAMVIPQQMGFLPSRIRLNRSAANHRALYGSDLIHAWPFLIVAMVLVTAAGLPLHSATGPVVAWSMSVSAMFWVATSAYQDHVRTALHISGRHDLAAVVSVTNLAICGAGLTWALLFAGQAPAGVAALAPFTILGVANAISAATGVVAHRHQAPLLEAGTIGLVERAKTAASGFLLQAAGYATNLITVSILGAAALANLEGARVAAQPVFVAATAMSSFFLPQAIRLQQTGNRTGSLRKVKRMASGQLLVGGVYAALLPLVVPVLVLVTGRSIDIPLSAARAGAFAMQSVVAPLNQLNLAASRYAVAFAATAISIISSLSSLLILLPLIGYFAVPTSMAVGAIVRAVTLFLTREGRDG